MAASLRRLVFAKRRFASSMAFHLLNVTVPITPTTDLFLLAKIAANFADVPAFAKWKYIKKNCQHNPKYFLIKKTY